MRTPTMTSPLRRPARAWSLFGPLLWDELTRLARRHWLFQERNLLLLTLSSFVFTLLFSAEFDEAVFDFPQFVQMTIPTLMWMQLLGMVIGASTCAADVVAGEKEKQRLDFILLTDLSDREIVLGRLAARLFYLYLPIFALLPILAFLQVLGNFDSHLLLAFFAVTGLTVLSHGAVGACASVLARRTGSALRLTCFLTFGYLFLSGGLWALLRDFPSLGTFPSTGSWTSPVELEDVTEWLCAGNLFTRLADLRPHVIRGDRIDAVLPRMVGGYALFHGLITVLGFSWAVARLRPIARRQAEGVPKPAEAARPARTVWDRAMVWKEVVAEPTFRFSRVARILLLLLAAASFVVPAVLIVLALLNPDTDGKQLPETMNRYVTIVGTGVASLLLLGVVVRAADGVAGERDRRTLDELLTTPLGSSEILFAKGLGALLSVRWGVVWLGGLWLVALLTGAMSVGSVGTVLVLGAAWLVYAVGVAGLGLWRSIESHTTDQARAATLIYLMLLFGGPWVAGGLFCRPNPLRPWFETRPTVPSLVGVAVWACLAALFFWWRAVVRFRAASGREATRRPERRAPEAPAKPRAAETT